MTQQEEYLIETAVKWAECLSDRDMVTKIMTEANLVNAVNSYLLSIKKDDDDESR